MNKPVVAFTRPRDWVSGGYGSELLELVHVPISGSGPVKRNGRPAGDGIGDVVTKAGIEKLHEVILERKPDVFFHSIHAKVGPAILSWIRENSPKTKIVVMDGNDPDRVGRYANRHKPWIDKILLNSRDPNTFAAYRRFGFREDQIGTLYDGFVPAEHPEPAARPIHDCFFAGSNIRGDNHQHLYPGGPFRERFILAVHRAFKLDLHGYPHEWPVKVQARLHYPEYYLAFHGARIAINANHLDLVRYYTRRTIHAGASGRAYVVKRIPGMEEDFGENGKHIAWFDEVEDGLSLIRHYLEHEAEREEMARRCRVLFLERHSWQARLREFERIVLEML